MDFEMRMKMHLIFIRFDIGSATHSFQLMVFFAVLVESGNLASTTSATIQFNGKNLCFGRW